MKLKCNDAAKNVSAGVASCNIKRRNLFGNVETGLEMLPLVCTLSAILVWTLPVNHGCLLVTVSDWLTRRRVKRTTARSVSERGVVFITTAIISSVAKVESDSTFSETT